MLPKQTVNYRRKHIVIIISAIYLVLCALESYFPFLSFMMKISYIFISFLMYSLFSGKVEKKDEFTKASLSKATEITFYILLAAIFIVSGFMFDVSSDTAANLCYYLILGAIGLRSVLFLIFDHTPAEKEEE